MKQLLNKKREEFRIEIRINNNQTIFRNRRIEITKSLKPFPEYKLQQIFEIAQQIKSISIFQPIKILPIMKRLKCFHGQTLNNRTILEFVSRLIILILQSNKITQYPEIFLFAKQTLNQFLTSSDLTICKHLDLFENLCNYPGVIELYYNISLIEQWNNSKYRQIFLEKFINLISQYDFHEQKQIIIIQNFLIKSEAINLGLIQKIVSRLQRILNLNYYIQLSEQSLIGLINTLTLLIFGQQQGMIIVKHQKIIEILLDIFIKNVENKIKNTILTLIISLFKYNQLTDCILKKYQIIIQILKKEVQQKDILKNVLKVFYQISAHADCISLLLSDQITENIILLCTRRNLDKSSKVIGYQILLNMIWYGNDEQCRNLLIKNIACILLEILKGKQERLIAFGLECIEKLLDCHERTHDDSNKKIFNIKNQLQNRYRLSQILEELSYSPIKKISQIANKLLQFF